jgi:hypothetical protein
MKVIQPGCDYILDRTNIRENSIGEVLRLRADVSRSPSSSNIVKMKPPCE